MRETTIIVSGIVPGPTGMGRLLEHLVDAARKVPGEVRFLFGNEGTESIKAYAKRGEWGGLLRSLCTRAAGKWNRRRLQKGWFHFGEASLVLMHPQSIGYAECRKLIERQKKCTWIFLADSSFFCMKSYNHLPGELRPCTRCVGGHFHEAKAHGCQPFPKSEADPIGFLTFLREQAQRGKVGFLAQNDRQQALALQHFGNSVQLHKVGMWVKEFDDIATAEVTRGETEFDVVLHGAHHEAKGSLWAMALARALPELRFLFPFHAPDMNMPANCVCKPMSWETGLRQQICNARLVLNPSLWSASIESALVKSIVYARAVALPRNATAYSDEISGDVILKLPEQPEEAAQTLRAALAGNWLPEPKAKQKFVQDYGARNHDFLKKILAASANLGKNPR